MTQLPEDERYQTAWLIRRVFRAMADVAGTYLESLGISAAERAVMEFLRRDGKQTVPELAKRYQVSRQHVQVTINALVAKGLVASEPNPLHKRSALYMLTGDGHSLFLEIEKRDRVALDTLFSGIAPTAARQTRRTLQTMLSNLREGEDS